MEVRLEAVLTNRGGPLLLFPGSHEGDGEASRKAEEEAGELAEVQRFAEDDPGEDKGADRSNGADNGKFYGSGPLEPPAHEEGGDDGSEEGENRAVEVDSGGEMKEGGGLMDDREMNEDIAGGKGHRQRGEPKRPDFPDEAAGEKDENGIGAGARKDESDAQCGFAEAPPPVSFADIGDDNAAISDKEGEEEPSVPTATAKKQTEEDDDGRIGEEDNALKPDANVLEPAEIDDRGEVIADEAEAGQLKPGKRWDGIALSVGHERHDDEKRQGDEHTKGEDGDGIHFIGVGRFYKNPFRAVEE